MPRLALTVAVVTVLSLLPAAGFAAEEKPKPKDQQNLDRRYGIDVNLEKYPQDEPKESLRSIIKAAKAGDFEYLLAHLASPTQMDKRLDNDETQLKGLAKQLAGNKAEAMINGLTRHLNQGTWDIQDELAWSEADGQNDVSLEKIGKRWFLHNRAVDKPAKKE